MSNKPPLAAIGAAALSLALTVGCSSNDGGNTPKTCPPGCPTGQCDTSTGTCLGTPSCTADGTPVRLCGQTCVDITSDAAHCGACFSACAAGETCGAGICKPSLPSTPPTTCSATQVNACGAPTQWCNAALGVCRPCPGGANAYNCDGMNDCECGNGCEGTQCAAGTTPPTTVCDVVKPGACGTDVEQYCSANTRGCIPCEGVLLNCDLTNTCECNSTTHECDNGACREKATPTKPSTCKESQYWDGSTCHDCPQFDYDCNADASDGCECLFADAAIGCYWDGTCDFGMD